MNIELPLTRQKRPPDRAAAAEAEREPPKSKIARTTDEHREQPAEADEPRSLSVAAISIMLHSLCDSPGDILSLSLVSKDIHSSCKESMEEVCRRRWGVKFEFHRRWGSARTDFESANAGPAFWYYRYFEEELKAIKHDISEDDLKRLSWKLEKSTRPLQREYVLRFSGEAPWFKKGNNLIIRAIAQGRTQGSLRFLLGGPSSRRASWKSTNWFLQRDRKMSNGSGRDGGRDGCTVLCLGTPNGICLPCMKFKVYTSPDTWQHVIQSELYVLRGFP